MTKLLRFAPFCALLAALAFPAAAETIPFFSTYPKIDAKRWYVSHGWTNGGYMACEWRSDAIKANPENNALTFTISDRSGSIRPIGCGEMKTKARTTYGLYEARMRPAAGRGLNTAFFTYVGPPQGVKEHDEIDFEFLGKDPTKVQINYYVAGQGKHEVMVPLGFDASKEFHTYAFEWTPGAIRWYVDGKLVHQTPPGARLPRNPSSIYLSLWAGSPQVKDWLGSFHYAGPVTAEFAWVKFTPLPANP